eukprot:1867120-Prymnesium_polylepis.1
MGRMRKAYCDIHYPLTPRPIEALRGVRVSAGDIHIHSLVLGRGGEVYSFGRGYHGQLGHGDLKHQHSPQVIKALKGVRVRAMAAGSEQSLYGRLGHGDQRSQLLPKRIEAVSNVQVVSAGDAHSMLLTEAGVIYSFGEGDYGPLGHNSTDTELEPRIVEALRSVKVCAIVAGAHMLSLIHISEPTRRS